MRLLFAVVALCLAPFFGNVQAATITMRGTPTTTNGASTSMVLVKPTGVVSGDVLLVSIAQYHSGAHTNATSAGWTLIKNGGLGSVTRHGSILYKVAGASEGATYTFTLSSGTGLRASGALIAFSGVDNGAPLDVDATNLPAFATANSTAVAASSITTLTANAVAIMVGMAASTTAGTGGTWSAWSAGLTEIYDYQGTGTVNGATSIGAALKTNTSAGATGSGSATLSASMRNGGLWVALRPAANPADATNTTVMASPTSIPADGVTTSLITVTSRDSGNLPVWGKTITLSSSRGASDVLSAASGLSGTNGVVTFTVRSSTAGTSVYTATNTTDNVTVTQMATVVYTVGTNKDFTSFGTNVMGSSAIINTGTATVAWTVPAGSDVTTLAPVYTVSIAATGSPASGTTHDFTTPQTYIITAQDLSTKSYGVTVTVAPSSTNKDINAFGTNYAGSSAVINTNAGTIAWTLPAGWPITSLAPIYSVSLFASGSPVSGTTRDFTNPQTNTITAQDGSTKNYVVTATITVGPQNYSISLDTDVAQEFSPMNRSGHPIVTGLDNYSNSIVVGGKKGLLAGAMKAPWNSNVGSQTMMCSDCHNTDASTPAAQGPHGSAYQYMLRGSNPSNWPNVTSFANSWCANCHQDNVNATVHTRGAHINGGCYRCHIVIPHGAKVSRLLATRTGGLPLRYAYNCDSNNVGLASFTKQANDGYAEDGTCRDACKADGTADKHSGAALNEAW